MTPDELWELIGSLGQVSAYGPVAQLEPALTARGESLDLHGPK